MHRRIARYSRCIVARAHRASVAAQSRCFAQQANVEPLQNDPSPWWKASVKISPWQILGRVAAVLGVYSVYSHLKAREIVLAQAQEVIKTDKSPLFGPSIAQEAGIRAVDVDTIEEKEPYVIPLMPSFPDAAALNRRMYEDFQLDIAMLEKTQLINVHYRTFDTPLSDHYGYWANPNPAAAGASKPDQPAHSSPEQVQQLDYPAAVERFYKELISHPWLMVRVRDLSKLKQTFPEVTQWKLLPWQVARNVCRSYGFVHGQVDFGERIFERSSEPHADMFTQGKTFINPIVAPGAENAPATKTKWDYETRITKRQKRGHAETEPGGRQLESSLHVVNTIGDEKLWHGVADGTFGVKGTRIGSTQSYSFRDTVQAQKRSGDTRELRSVLAGGMPAPPSAPQRLNTPRIIGASTGGPGVRAAHRHNPLRGHTTAHVLVVPETTADLLAMRALFENASWVPAVTGTGPSQPRDIPSTLCVQAPYLCDLDSSRMYQTLFGRSQPLAELMFVSYFNPQNHSENGDICRDMGKGVLRAACPHGDGILPGPSPSSLEQSPSLGDRLLGWYYGVDSKWISQRSGVVWGIDRGAVTGAQKWFDSTVPVGTLSEETGIPWDSRPFLTNDGFPRWVQDAVFAQDSGFLLPGRQNVRTAYSGIGFQDRTGLLATTGALGESAGVRCVNRCAHPDAKDCSCPYMCDQQLQRQVDGIRSLLPPHAAAHTTTARASDGVALPKLVGRSLAVNACTVCRGGLGEMKECLDVDAVLKQHPYLWASQRGIVDVVMQTDQCALLQQSYHALRPWQHDWHIPSVSSAAQAPQESDWLLWKWMFAQFHGGGMDVAVGPSSPHRGTSLGQNAGSLEIPSLKFRVGVGMAEKTDTVCPIELEVLSYWVSLASMPKTHVSATTTPAHEPSTDGNITSESEGPGRFAVACVSDMVAFAADPAGLSLAKLEEWFELVRKQAAGAHTIVFCDKPTPARSDWCVGVANGNAVSTESESTTDSPLRSQVHRLALNDCINLAHAYARWQVQNEGHHACVRVLNTPAMGSSGGTD